MYQCEECGFKYVEKEWAEKCETWCKEHKSCNIEITAHGMPSEDETKNNHTLNEEDRKFLTKLFYGLIGIASSLAFFLILYWVLRLDSSITNIITNTYDTPLYFWPYVILTFGAIVLFGVNISLFVLRSRKFGPPKLKTESGTGFGSLFGIAASACPVCGSTILSAIGIAGGLTAFPLGGLELKAISLGFLALPIWLIRKDIKKLESDCVSGTCPVPQDHRFKESDRPWFFALLALVIMLSLIGWNWLKTEPIIAKALTNNNHGSALRGLLQLGASQGLSEEELYREALAFNSFWFPQNSVFKISPPCFLTFF